MVVIDTRFIDYTNRIAELERKLEETTIELGRVSWEFFGVNNKLADKDAQLKIAREALQMMQLTNAKHVDWANYRIAAEALKQLGVGECVHENDGTALLSMPPQYKCIKCGKFYT